MRNGFTFLLVCILIQSSTLAQQFESVIVKNRFDLYLKNNLQEKIYVHTDKNSYMAGEIVWFKIYNVEAYTNRPISFGDVAYLEVLDKEQTVVLQTKVGLKNGSGSLYIPVTLSSGSYTLRCYTNWMKNFDPFYFFHKDLAIYNSLKKEEAQVTEVKKKYTVQFFPEGGNLVLGMKSKVAFKAVDAEGQFFNFRGCLMNAAGDTMVRFSPLRDGLGTFYFIPSQLRGYKVLITPVNEKPFSLPIPDIYEKGAVMSTSLGHDSTLNVSVQSNLESQGSYTLFVHSGHHTVFNQSLNSESISQGFKVPYKLLGEGISHLTLFNSAGQPLCERLYYKKPSKAAEIKISTNKKNYYNREKVNVSIEVTTRGKPTNARFSLAVYKVDSIQVQDEDIFTSLWLTSELKGRVSNASSYLKNYQEESIDNLMLTHGWRRFKWEDVLEEKKPELKFLPEPEGHIISGYIRDNNTKQAISGKNAFLSIPGKRIQFYTSYSNQAGKINFFTKDFFDNSSGIVVQTDIRKDSLARIEIGSPFSSSFSDYLPGEVNFKNSIDNLLQRSVAMQVNNAFKGRQLNKRHSLPVNSSSFYQKPEKIYDLDNYVRFKTMEEVLREYVSEINVAVRKKDYNLSVFDRERNEFHSSSPLILLDGVPVFDEGTTIIKYDPLKVKQLEVVTGGYIYGNNVFPGIASFRTFNGDLNGLELPAHATILDYEGLQSQREFYSPMYEGDANQSSRIPDYRTTLFWNANKETSNEGSATVDFFTSDLPGKYYVVVQSLSKDGYCGSGVIEFNVAGENTAMTKKR